MTENYLTNITPDSLSGLIFAFEGVKNTVVLLNGPTGCKFYHSATSDNQALRQSEFDPLNYPELWYFGQPRIPCTYLDKRDYVYGSEDKLKDAIGFLCEYVDFELLVIVNSPGAALIGDDIERIAKSALEKSEKGSEKKHLITVETPGYSKYIWDGYENACMSMIKTFAKGKPWENADEKDGGCKKKETCSSDKKKTKVNLLGMSIFHRMYEGNIAEIKRLLELCDIEVLCIPACRCSVSEIENLAEADFNIVLDPVYGLGTAKFLKDEWGMPYVCEGVPVGFSATERLMDSVHELSGCNLNKFRENAERARARSYMFFSRLNSLTGLPKGARFAVHGTSADCLAYCDFLMKYMAMEPTCVSIIDYLYEEELMNLLARYGRSEALSENILKTDAMIVFADGNIIAKLKALGHEFSGIEISMPSMGYTDVIPKSNMGLSGALYVCEQVINGIIY